MRAIDMALRAVMERGSEAAPAPKKKIAPGGRAKGRPSSKQRVSLDGESESAMIARMLGMEQQGAPPAQPQQGPGPNPLLGMIGGMLGGGGQ